MAVDCMTRMWALAIATAACIGIPSALVYAMVRIAVERRYGATFTLGLVLISWVTVSAAYYPRVCADLVPWLRFLHLCRRCRGRGRGQGEPSLLVPQPSSFATVDVFPPWPRQAPAPAAAHGGRAHVRVPSSDPLAQRYGDRRVVMMPVFPWEAPEVVVVPPPLPPRYPLLYEQQREVPLPQSYGGDGASTSRMTMAALPREPPAARGKARAGADVPWPPCDDGPSKYCVICMTDVDKEETAKRLPLCLHVFHRQCIDQWLRGHSTCPICRCNAFPSDSCMSLYGR